MFPNRKKKSGENEDEIYASFTQALKELRLQLPLTDAIRIPVYSKFLKNILNRKKKVLESIVVVSSYTLEGKLPTKLEDPGIPTITCGIGKDIIHNALCDLGAGLSVMPFYLYKKLGLHDYVPTSVTLQMADKTMKQPVGMIEDVLLRLDDHVIPTDFIILDMPEDDILSII